MPAKLDIQEIESLAARVKSVGKLQTALNRSVADAAKRLGVDWTTLWCALVVYGEQPQSKAQQ